MRVKEKEMVVSFLFRHPLLEISVEECHMEMNAIDRRKYEKDVHEESCQTETWNMKP